MEISPRFPRYERHDPLVPVWCVTPGEGRCIHRFFDTSPVSPDGSRLAVFRLPFEDRQPRPGDAGQVVVVDLATAEERVVAETRGWEPQMGCNLNWAGPQRLAFNDVDPADGSPRLVLLDVDTGRREEIPGGVYHVSPDGRYAASASMEKMRRTQPGYGVVLPDDRVGRNVGTPDDDGLFITDLETGERRLAFSLADAAAVIPELGDLSDAGREAWETYGFHAKWNPQGDRLIFTVRRYRNRGEDRFDAFSRKRDEPVRFDVLTLRPDGSEAYDAVPADKWEKGGHHINFFPDGRTLSMNLGHFREDRGLDLVRVNHDGTGLAKMTDAVAGSGHPTVHRDGRHVLADTYFFERWTRDGHTPLRWIDLEAGTEREAARIGNEPPSRAESVLRVDPHPAWDPTWRYVAFNAVEGGTRRVYLADFAPLLDEAAAATGVPLTAAG